MRSAPLNYLMTGAVFGLLWVAFGVFVNSWLADNISFNNLSPEQFTSRYQIVLGITALIGFGISAVWYAFGSKKENATVVAKACARWTTLLVCEIVVSVALFGAFAILFRGEGVTGMQYGVVYFGDAILTFVPFWVCSLVASPKFVEYCPIGKR